VGATTVSTARTLTPTIAVSGSLDRRATTRP
jgi:hypothetical protein